MKILLLLLGVDPNSENAADFFLNLKICTEQDPDCQDSSV